MKLNEAAEQFAPTIENVYFMSGFKNVINEAKQFAFKAGAAWQKEQYITKAKEIGDKIPYPNKYIFESIISQLLQTD